MEKMAACAYEGGAAAEAVLAADLDTVTARCEAAGGGGAPLPREVAVAAEAGGGGSSAAPLAAAKALCAMGFLDGGL